MLWHVLWTAASYAPGTAHQRALSPDTDIESSDAPEPLLAKYFVEKLGEAAAAAGVPKSWPDIPLAAGRAKLLIDLERARVLAWKEWATQQSVTCTEHRQGLSQLRGSRPQPQTTERSWPRPFALLALVLLMLCSLAICGKRLGNWPEGQPAIQSSPGPARQCQIELCQRALQTERSVDPPTLLSPTRVKKIQRTDSWMKLANVGVQTDLGEACATSASAMRVGSQGEISQSALRQPSAWMRAERKQPWSDTRRSSRFMLQPQQWSEAFDDAYLGVVEERGGEISIGFGGTVRQGQWADFLMASKQFHRGDTELFAELYFGLLIGSSPTLGFCATADGDPRLISAWLPETSMQHVRRTSWSSETSKAFVCDLLLAVLSVHELGLVHGRFEA